MILLEKNHVIYSGMTRELSTAAEEVPRVSLTLKRCFMNNLRGYRSRLGVQNNIHGHPTYPHRCNYYLLLRSFLPSTFADLLQRLQKRGIPLSSPIKSQLWSRCGSDLTSKKYILDEARIAGLGIQRRRTWKIPGQGGQFMYSCRIVQAPATTTLQCIIALIKMAITNQHIRSHSIAIL